MATGRFIRALVLALVASGMSQYSYASSSYDYLGKATNSLYALDDKSSPQEVLQAYRDGCGALRRLDKDEDFKRRLNDKAGSKSKLQVPDEALKAAQELADSFVVPEITPGVRIVVVLSDSYRHGPGAVKSG
ncbi:hypothetical protein [Caballeronia sordidicola]|uniref:hypothetical protein n=1 Tax=Caballeronia sordidicola TaxID=196367 RepID=UPI0004D0224A|nr:hypothetical protein [Caballeronia sordidicola]